MARIKVKEQYVDVDLLQLLSDYGIKGRQIGNEFVAACPFHDDRSPSWSIKLDGDRAGLWQCFASNCESKGNIISLIMKMENCGYKEAIASLTAVDTEIKVKAEDLEVTIKKLQAIGLDIRQESLRYPVPQDCSRYYVKEFFTNPRSEGGRGYSESDFSQLKVDHILYCESGFFRNKIIIPVYNEFDEQVSFVARTLDKDILEKYRYPRGWMKNLFVCRLEGDPALPPIVCEGMFDGLHIQGIWGRTALVVFGSSLTTKQVAWIAKRYDHVTMGLDGDEAGRKGAYKSIKNMQQFGTDVDVLWLPDGFDPPMVSRMELEGIKMMAAKEYGKKWEQGHTLKRFSMNGDPRFKS
ncbi:MAG: CHC2 zinc finger domain-containing protein [Candidatus Izemoplasmatales bacterium]